MKTDIRRLVAEIVKERERLLRIADTLAERFREMERKQAKGAKENRGYHGIRTRRNVGGVSIQWYKRRFPKSPDGKSLVRHDYLTLGRGTTYTDKAFSGMREWERQAANAVEQEAAHIRARAAQLATMLKMAKAYQREVERFSETYPATIEETNFDDLESNIESMVDDVLEGRVRSEYD